ncbi:hypothetical protein [Actinophytocola sp.]|uniref:hypothetical protein n=1 Tax=Actinophytocola sp. TaxID=1872138 RepID=UPI002D5667E0|nr:hypothetical protein [Actinophytocola sp.]HYQ67874.1 hypothetical protein [Actinophytocola sp.]
MDRPFRNLVIRKVHNDSRRRVAPSYGFDLVPVVRQAWRAWLLEVGQHTAALAVLTAGLVSHQVLAVVMVLCACATYVLLIIGVRNLAAFLRVRAANEATRWSDRQNQLPREDQEKRKRRFKASSAGCAMLVLAPFFVARKLDTTPHAAMPAAVVLASALLLCGVLAGVIRQLQLNANHHARSLRPPNLTRREEAIDEQQNHTCVAYLRPPHRKDADLIDLMLDQKGSSSPFVGSGTLVNRWLPPTTVQLIRPDPLSNGALAQREHLTPPFRAHELVDCLRSALRQLTHDTGTENLPGLRVRDRLYVPESDISADRTLLGGDAETMINEVIDDPRYPAHHFLETSVPIAGGELVMTVLIRVSLKGRCLSLDVATCALTRTPQRFQVIDRYAEHGFGAVVRAAVRDLFRQPGNVLRMWRLVEAPVVAGRAWWAIKDRTHRPRRRIPVCARVAVRESVADDWLNAQLDETTIYDHMKIIEQRILRIVVDFLRAHDVDTSDFERQAMNIISSGVLNMGHHNNNIVANNEIKSTTNVTTGSQPKPRTATKEPST